MGEIRSSFYSELWNARFGESNSYFDEEFLKLLKVDKAKPHEKFRTLDDPWEPSMRY